jgi:hypothetical protein
MKGISRIDTKDTHGWFVRAYHDGKTHSRFFSDNPHGGRDKASKKAIAYRDKYYRDHNIQHLPFFTKPMPQNTTGINGVSETYQRARNGTKIPCFSVFWAPYPNVRKTKRFYFHHYNSREDALQAAAEFRKEREKEILRRHNKRKRQERRSQTD